MTFNSLSFFVFLPVAVGLYYLLPRQSWRIVWLLIMSCVFYMALIPQYILVLFFLITVDYTLGLLMGSAAGTRRTAYLIISILANIGTLFLFKYFNVFAGLGWALPLGLSFHVFQSLSYVIEVYRGKYPAERNFVTYALYVMFFPQLVAGPIERPAHLLPQLKLHQPFLPANIIEGGQRILWGFIKKRVIADHLSLFVDPVYAHLPEAQGISIFVATLLFTLQLYFDFSGYVDMALGSAKMLGIELSPNFNNPFLSRSYAEFWRRWHISLSNWFRDYFYLPLAIWGRAWGPAWLHASIILTFLVVGIWHGAGWTFVTMGLLSGFYIVFGTLTAKARARLNTLTGLSRLPRVHAILQMLITFCLVSFVWIFFRAQSMGDALYAVRHLFSWHSLLANLNNSGFISQYVFMGYRPSELYVPLVCAGALLAAEFIADGRSPIALLQNKNLFWKVSIQTFAVLVLVVYGVFQSKQFIYFQF